VFLLFCNAGVTVFPSLTLEKLSREHLLLVLKATRTLWSIRLEVQSEPRPQVRERADEPRRREEKDDPRENSEDET
jgi:hypothetical protein